jgi:hypothetical protein
MHDLLPGQVIGERFAFRLPPRRDRDRGFAGFGAGDILGLAGLQLLQLQLQLLVWRVIRSEDRPNCIRRSLAI